MYGSAYLVQVRLVPPTTLWDRIHAVSALEGRNFRSFWTLDPPTW